MLRCARFLVWACEKLPETKVPNISRSELTVSSLLHIDWFVQENLSWETLCCDVPDRRFYLYGLSLWVSSDWDQRLLWYTRCRPSSHKHYWASVVSMLAQRRRRWANIKTTLAQRLVFAVSGLRTGNQHDTATNAGLMFNQRLWHCPNITPALWQCMVLALRLYARCRGEGGGGGGRNPSTLLLEFGKPLLQRRIKQSPTWTVLS